MSKCSVYGCSLLSNTMTQRTYHKFPHANSIFCKKWVVACRRKDPINVKTAVICSDHFSDKQKVRDLRSELLGISPPINYRCLKIDAIPDLKLPLSVVSSSSEPPSNFIGTVHGVSLSVHRFKRHL